MPVNPEEAQSNKTEPKPYKTPKSRFSEGLVWMKSIIARQYGRFNEHVDASGLGSLVAKDYWPLIVSLILAGVAAYTAREIQVQADLMDRQLQEMQGGSAQSYQLTLNSAHQAAAAKALAEQSKDQVDKMKDMVKRASDQAKATNRLATSNQGQLTLNKELASLDHGAHLEPQSISLFHFDDGRITSGILFRNTGEVEASAISIRSRMALLSSPPSFAMRYDTAPLCRKALVGTPTLRKTQTTHYTECSDAALTDLPTGFDPDHNSPRLYLWGSAGYSDIFGAHTAHFCRVFDVATVLRSPPGIGNGAGLPGLGKDCDEQ